eukprot:3699543-Rhodomonas_salina.2
MSFAAVNSHTGRILRSMDEDHGVTFFLARTRGSRRTSRNTPPPYPPPLIANPARHGISTVGAERGRYAYGTYLIVAHAPWEAVNCKTADGAGQVLFHFTTAGWHRIQDISLRERT